MLFKTPCKLDYGLKLQGDTLTDAQDGVTAEPHVFPQCAIPRKPSGPGRGTQLGASRKCRVYHNNLSSVLRNRCSNSEHRYKEGTPWAGRIHTGAEHTFQCWASECKTRGIRTDRAPKEPVHTQPGAHIRPPQLSTPSSAPGPPSSPCNPPVTLDVHPIQWTP